MKITLVKYRDAFLPTYTWFWVDEKNKVVSPYFDNEKEAFSWAKEKKQFKID